MINSQHIITQYVQLFYRDVLGGNFLALSDEDLREFEEQSIIASRSIKPQIVEALLLGHWRESMMGAWYVAIKRLTQFKDLVGGLLLASERCYAGQTCAIAMAMFGDSGSVKLLQRYLDHFLTEVDCYYDQDWAMSALIWIDECQRTAFASPYLSENGLWNDFISNKLPGTWDINRSYRHFEAVMSFVSQLALTINGPHSNTG
jgi:Family of unknown function (DUF6000)